MANLNKDENIKCNRDKNEEENLCRDKLSTVEHECLDDIWTSLGSPGKLQIIWFIILATNIMSASQNAVVGVFFGFTPTHRCNATLDLYDFVHIHNADDQQNATYLRGLDKSGRFINILKKNESSNISKLNYQTDEETIGSEWFRNLTIKHGACAVRLVSQSKDIGVAAAQSLAVDSERKCQRGEWIYDVDGREATTVTDFDLICGQGHLSHLASSLYYLGLMLANFILGYASDAFGRRPVILLALHLMIATGFGIAVAPYFLMFVALRVLMGILAQGTQSTSFVLALELFSARHHGSAGAIFQILWGVGTLYLALVAWLTKDWRRIQLLMLIPTVLSAIGMWYVGESARWLLARGHTKRAGHVISRIAEFNKVSNPLDNDPERQQYQLKALTPKHLKSTSEQKLKNPRSKGAQMSYLALVRTPVMRRRTIFLSTCIFGLNLGYFGTTYNNAELSGDRYFNFFLGSLTETIAYTVGSALVIKFGRRNMFSACLISGAVLCVLSGVIPNQSDTSKRVITTISIIGRFSFAAAYCAADTLMAELFPTVLRNMGVGVCTFAGRLGSAVAPLVLILRQAGYPQLPPLVFAAFAFTGGIFGLLLPETRGMRLPDTVEDVEGNLQGKSTQEQELSVEVTPEESFHLVMLNKSDPLDESKDLQV